jgi:hypothetical protein
MSRQIAVGLYVVAMIAIMIGVDLVFFRKRTWERLMVNISPLQFTAAKQLSALRSETSLSEAGLPWSRPL